MAKVVWLLTKVDGRSEKVLTGELATIKPSALPYITTIANVKIEKSLKIKKKKVNV